MAANTPENEPQVEVWVVVDNKKEEIEVWSTQEKAEQSMAAKGVGEGVFLYHLPHSELTKSFPNRPIGDGDLEAQTKNKYIRKGWDPGMRK